MGQGDDAGKLRQGTTILPYHEYARAPQYPTVTPTHPTVDPTKATPTPPGGALVPPPGAHARAKDKGAEEGTEDQQRISLPAERSSLPAERSSLPAERSSLPAERSSLPAEKGRAGTTGTTDQPKTPVYREVNQIVPAGADLPPGGAEVPPPGAEVPPDEVLKALHIVNVDGMGYMKASQGPNGTIVMVPVDPLTSASKWSHSKLMVP